MNVHKHINTGEGGILVTNNDKYAMKMRLIRNHAETVVTRLKIKNISNMIGYNFRLGEIESAIGIEQLKKLNKILRERQKIVTFLINGLKNLEGLKVPEIQDKCTHSFYIFPIVLDVKKININRDIIIKKLKNLGVQGLYPGYENVHLLPIYQKKIAYGSKGFPWKAKFSRKNISYKKGICPVAERLHDKELISFEICQFDLNHKDIKLIIKSFKRVWKYYGLSTN